MKTNETIEQEKTDLTKKSGPSILVVLSTVLFATVCTISAFLFFENVKLSASIEANKNDIAQYTNGIEKIKSDRKNIAAELVTNNKPEILASIKAGEVQTYINELLSTSKKYKMIFSGFSYQNGKITTSAVSIPETILAGDDGVKKISNFIHDYRTGTGLLFELAPVLSISGYEQKRTFSIEFSTRAAPSISAQK